MDVGSRNVRSQDGAVLVVTAVVLLVLIGIAALAIDIPIAMAERRDAQNAADHASLTAAWTWCEFDDWRSAADDSVVGNGYETSQLELSRPFTGYFRAAITSESSTFFGQIFGASEIAVATTSISRCSSAGETDNALFAVGEDCYTSWGKRGIDGSGQTHTVWGGIHSNSTVYFGTEGNDYGGGHPDSDPITFVNDDPASFWKDDNLYDAGYPSLTGIQPDPYNFQFDDYAPGSVKAINASTEYHNFGSNEIRGVDIAALGDGLYFTAGDINVDVSDLGRPDGLKATFVAGGSIAFSGSGQIVEPYVDRLLAFSASEQVGDKQCDEAVLFPGGSDQWWEGIFYAPRGQINLSGSTNYLLGSVVAYAIYLPGTSLHIESDPRRLGGIPVLRLLE